MGNRQSLLFLMVSINLLFYGEAIFHQEECVIGLTSTVDKFLHVHYNKIILPQRTVLGFVNLHDGHLDTLESIQWNSTLVNDETVNGRNNDNLIEDAKKKRSFWTLFNQEKDHSKAIHVKSTAIVSKITAKYNCSLTGFAAWFASTNASCQPEPVIMTGLVINLNLIHVPKTGQIQVKNVNITDGQYEINGTLMGKQIHYKDKLPDDMKKRFQDFIEETAEKIGIHQVQGINCS